MESLRICPKCNLKLNVVVCFGEKLDQCHTCLGFWFDAKELDQLKSKMDNNIRWIDIDLWTFANRSNFIASEFDCPKCQTLMTAFQYDDSNVTLEFCINCGGVWLDQGELEIVLRSLSEKMTKKSVRELGAASLEQFAQIFGGPKGVVEEVKDFVAAWRMVSLKFSITHPNLKGKIKAVCQSTPF